MTRIQKAFDNQKAFIAFVTGGDPDVETTKKLIPEMAKAGADLIEIGIPFSDPIAEGVVIQEADVRALSAGTTTDDLFDMVKEVRKETDVPLVFMTYMNPVYTYGTERFMKKCAECGIDGVIIPDVPFEENDEVSGACEAAGVGLISMIAPTSKERIHMIAEQAKQVSDIPCAIGFGISTPQQAYEMAAKADGAIVGSAIVKLVARYGKDCIAPVCEYIKEMKAAVSRAEN